jgi:hypothetical protein
MDGRGCDLVKLSTEIGSEPWFATLCSVALICSMQQAWYRVAGDTESQKLTLQFSQDLPSSWGDGQLKRWPLWLTPVIPATWEVEIRRISVQCQPRKKVSETPFPSQQ